uniref:BRCT domain-containing protein n=1 Tax=Nippostrongylus brasiliensis TaxID=27835 RepID=A0A0N4XE00_NIPBR
LPHILNVPHTHIFFYTLSLREHQVETNNPLSAHISPPLANDEKLNDEKATTSRLQQTPLKKKVLPAPGLKKSEFQGVFYVVGMNNRFEVQKQAPQQLAIHHAEDAMREKYRKRRTSKEELEMIKDPLYAVEVELSGMKSRKSGTTSAMEGTKLQSGKKKKKRSKKKQPEDAHDKARSTVTMMKVGEKVFEKRITDIGGHKVVVALGNKHLHGADLIARPGSVIHGRLPTGDEGVEALEKAKVGIRGSLLVQSEDALELPKELQFSDDKTLTKAQVSP